MFLSTCEIRLYRQTLSDWLVLLALKVKQHWVRHRCSHPQTLKNWDGEDFTVTYVAVCSPGSTTSEQNDCRFHLRSPVGCIVSWLLQILGLAPWPPVLLCKQNFCAYGQRQIQELMRGHNWTVPHAPSTWLETSHCKPELYMVRAHSGQTHTHHQRFRYNTEYIMNK